MKHHQPSRINAPKVLVVGGDDDGVRALRRSIRAAGYRHMIGTCDGAHAVLLALKQRPSIAIIETSVSGMTAYEVAERLQRLPDGCSIPVVLVAWESNEAPQMQARLLGAHGVLESPYDPADLARMIEEALQCPTAV